MNLKPVRSSNLMLRFYVSDGWSKSILDSFCTKGQVSIKHPDDTNPYYTLDAGSQLDIVQLYIGHVSVVHRAFSDYPNETDIAYMLRMV